MEIVNVRDLQERDYTGVRMIDELTQKQYRGADWVQLSEEEKELSLKSRASEFKLNVKAGYGYVAIRAEKIVGFILAHETQPFGGTVYVRHIAIEPDYQGMGIASQLYEALIKRAKENGIERITTLINKDNLPSIKLHKKLGFELKDRVEAVLQLR